MVRSIYSTKERLSAGNLSLILADLEWHAPPRWLARSLAYQSALLTTPLLLLYLLSHFLHFWSFLSTLITIGSILLVGYSAWRAFRDPSQAHPGIGGGVGGGLPRFYLPVIGDLADRWVGDE